MSDDAQDRHTGHPLWLIRPRHEEYTDQQSEWEDNPRLDPWEPWYDKAFGFVIAAPDEATARGLASKEGGDELNERVHNWITGPASGPERKDAWDDPNYSVCRCIAAASTFTEPTIVVRDFRSA